jgi:hypothetical protein
MVESWYKIVCCSILNFDMRELRKLYDLECTCNIDGIVLKENSFNVADTLPLHLPKLKQALAR